MLIHAHVRYAWKNLVMIVVMSYNVDIVFMLDVYNKLTNRLLLLCVLYVDIVIVHTLFVMVDCFEL